MSRSFLTIFVMVILLICSILLPLPAQTDRPPEKGGQIFQLNMPPIYKGHAGATFGWHRTHNKTDELRVLFHAGVMKDLLSPITGIAAIGLEGYGGFRGSKEADGGGRALLTIPTFHLTSAADYNIPDDKFSYLLRLEIPFRRSGIFGRGSEVRFEWITGRDNTFSAGINVPLWGRNIGETRPQQDAVELEKPPIERVEVTSRPNGMDEVLNHMKEGAHWITKLVTPLLDHGGAEPTKAYAEEVEELKQHITTVDSRFPNGHTLQEEVRLFHQEMERAFSIAFTGQNLSPDKSIEEGRKIAAAARRILLDEVLLPYNRLLGQRKVRDRLDQFAASGHAEFSRWLLVQKDIPEERFATIFYVFQTLVDMVEDTRKLQKKRWEDSRFVWLPLQLSLRAEDHDTQAEINDIIERGTQVKFTQGNRTWYTMNEDFQLEFARSVELAEDYHVLWIHDYRGLNGEGKPDEIAFRQTVNVYMTVLTQRIQEYDETGKLPDYFIFLDQIYFENNKTRLWFRVLQDPLSYKLNLPKGYEDWEKEFTEAQNALRSAVNESKLLQLERRQYGDKWLKKRIQVHISITNPADFSFNSMHVAGILPVPDNVMRDHRKIAFYDITEDDPYRGRAMFTGMGIGEHYVGRNWEDRAIIIQGPAALAVKDAARHLLQYQGFKPEEIPFPLRAKPKAPDYQTKIDAMVSVMNELVRGHAGTVIQLHNETGFAPKKITVEKAILYSLMPPGSLLKIPDSLWMSYLYASLLSGSALRGCKVLIVAPSLKSAPSAAAPTMARVHGLFSALIFFQNQLSSEIKAQEGLLKTGLYTPKVGVGDLAGRIRQARELQEHWLEEIYPKNPAISAVVDSVEQILRNGNYQGTYLVAGDSLGTPKLHMKANLFITESAWYTLISAPEMGPLMREYLVYLARQTGGPAEERQSALDTPPALKQAVYQLAAAMEQELALKEVQSAFAYFTIGSTNMDYRSMVMDGEVQITVCGWSALSGVMDFLLLGGLCEWVDTQQDLDRLLPPPGSMTRRIANLIRLLL
jgi:hypothetical protein